MFTSIRFVVAFALTIIATSLTTISPANAAGRSPNVVVILIDDLGFTDLACMGSKLYETPHLDRLASQGMTFTHAYSACTVCSPTRAALLTGKYPARLHITDWIAGHQRPHAKLRIPEWTKFLPLEEVTLAEDLKSHGYATGTFGKWHLGGEGYEPKLNGFDVNLGGTQQGSPPSYFAPFKLPNLADAAPGESLTERLTIEAERFIEANRERSFFVYLPHYAVHTPLQAKPEVVEKYRAKIEKLGLVDSAAAKGPRDLQTQHPQQHAVYAAMIESMDAGVGRLMQTLDRLKLTDDTIFIFTGDNGGLMSSTDNRPARVGKGSAYEGGVRVPLIVRYPPAVKPGTMSDAPAMTIDLLPTILDLAGLPAAGRPLDGVSLVPVLKQTGPLTREESFWHYPHYHPGGATPYGAIRRGDWRLVEFYEDDHVELYDLKNDVGEQHDRAAAEPQMVATLRTRLHAWRKEVSAQMPTPNPDADAAKDAGQGRGNNKPKQRPASRETAT